MSYKTTKKDFSEFKKECEYWIEYFGLLNWQVYFIHELRDGSRACMWIDIPGKVSTIQLSTIFNGTPQKNEVKKSGFHEVCELLLRELSALGEQKFAKDFVDGKTHDIIRRLENTIFKEHRP